MSWESSRRGRILGLLLPSDTDPVRAVNEDRQRRVLVKADLGNEPRSRPSCAVHMPPFTAQALQASRRPPEGFPELGEGRSHAALSPGDRSVHRVTNMTHEEPLNPSQQLSTLVVMLAGDAGDETAKVRRLGSVASQRGEESQAVMRAPPGRR